MMTEKEMMWNFARSMMYWRERMDMNADDFAEYIGVSRSTIYNYESGRCMPQLYTAMLISKKLGTSLDDMLRRRPCA
jgi:DNA-binding XRE family transcriptional regulator